MGIYLLSYLKMKFFYGHRYKSFAKECVIIRTAIACTRKKCDQCVTMAIYLQHIPWIMVAFNSSLTGKTDRHFAYDLFGSIFVNEHFCIFIKISVKFVPKGLINNNPALV